jgi:hypothetical protein
VVVNAVYRVVLIDFAVLTNVLTHGTGIVREKSKFICIIVKRSCVGYLNELNCSVIHEGRKS